ncbi:hypothetical protein QAD02_000364 [Eretmocerus hayati]|uniref:Uncharacterized protein n=1 Tax=Eretmocerus hayati TaxID=131215 RepID=A0ACC2NHS0_9HYME|nr:hypothetical protein QAD02_000364 [Eretmocerus hayati]
MELQNNLPGQTVRMNSESKDAKTEATDKQADFEEAISAAGYGRFHYILYLAIIPISWASVLDTSTASMIVPAAGCDLDLTFLRKGVLNAVVYAGMISSAFLWGFIADTFGRKPLVFYGYLLDAILNMFSGFSQNFFVLAAFKFACGFIVSGPYASIMTYCAEFHRAKDRPKITMWIGFFMSFGSIIGAALALLIIPGEWSLFLGSVQLHSWQIYLAVCSLPVFFGVFCIGFFPESPKFLMSQGHNEEALKVFRQIHKINSKKGETSFTIEALKSEVPTKTIENEKRLTAEIGKYEPNPKSLRLRIREGLIQMKPLISDSYFLKLLLILTIQFCGMSCMNTIRLWQPQLFSMLSEPKDDNFPIEDVPFCEIIDYSISAKANESMEIANNYGSDFVCVRKPVDGMVYINTIIISSSVLVFAVLGGLFSGTMNLKYLLCE